MESGASTALHETLHVEVPTDNGRPALQTDVCVVIGIHFVSLTEEYPAKKEHTDITSCDVSKQIISICSVAKHSHNAVNYRYCGLSYDEICFHFTANEFAVLSDLTAYSHN
jgi:hypothetical protein